MITTDRIKEQLSVSVDGSCVGRARSLRATQRILIQSLDLADARNRKLQRAEKDLVMVRTKRAAPLWAEIQAEAEEAIKDEERARRSLDALEKAITKHNRLCDRKGHRELRVER